MRIGCALCNQWVEDIGPWCKRYCDKQYCWPLKIVRMRIRLADSYGDGPLVNALCREIRQLIGDKYVP